MRLLLLTVLLAAAPFARACGVCIDDKIASCYDHAVITAALKRGHAVAFFALEGDIVRGAEMLKAVSNAIERARGARPGTGRVSLENGALSFAYDPQRHSANDVGRNVAGALADRRLKLTLLRVLQAQ